MKSFFHATVVLMSVLAFAINATEPNFVKITEIGVGKDELGNSTDRVSIGFTDGLGRGLQSKVNSSTLLTSDNGVIPVTSTFLTTSTFYDDASRPVIATKPFTETNCNGNFLPGSFSDINAKLITEYSSYASAPGADPIAYSQTSYYADPLSRVFESALPGLDNCMRTAGTSKVWYFGVGKNLKEVEYATGTIVFFNNGFVTKKEISGVGADLNTNDFIALNEYFQANTVVFSDGINYMLTVTKDAEGKFSQVLKDLFGRTVATAARKTSGENGLVISQTEYDILGNVLKLNPPVDVKPIDATEYLYNTLGQVIRTITPDRAKDTFVYNNAGLLVSKTTLSNDGIIKHLDYTYDDMQRLIRISIPHNHGYEQLVENFYDTPDNLVDNGRWYNVPPYYLGLITNCRGRLVATISYDRYDVNLLTVVDLYGYDEDGNISSKVKIVPGLPIQQITYTYDIHGKKLSENITYGTESIIKKYKYDCLGRLDSINHGDNKKLVKYNYDKFGQLAGKLMNSQISRSFNYTILGQVNSISGAMSGGVGFGEAIVYKKDGNINSSDQVYSSFSGAPSSHYAYHYDNLNRLDKVEKGASDYCAYAYDLLGRFNTKQEGASLNITGYTYHEKTRADFAGYCWKCNWTQL